MTKIFVIFIFIFSTTAFGNSKKYFEDKVHYRTVFGQCPSKIVGRLTLSLIKKFVIILKKIGHHILPFFSKKIR